MSSFDAITMKMIVEQVTSETQTNFNINMFHPGLLDFIAPICQPYKMRLI